MLAFEGVGPFGARFATLDARLPSQKQLEGVH
jgi:hypothetical protein